MKKFEGICGYRIVYQELEKVAFYIYLRNNICYNINAYIIK